MTGDPAATRLHVIGLEVYHILTLAGDWLKFANPAQKRRANISQWNEIGNKVRFENCWKELRLALQLQQRPQPLGLYPAHRNLGLLLIVHPQLEARLEPR